MTLRQRPRCAAIIGRWSPRSSRCSTSTSEPSLSALLRRPPARLSAGNTSAGSTSSGWTSMPTRSNPPAPRPSTRCGPRRPWCGSSAHTVGRRRTEGRTRTPARARAPARGHPDDPARAIWSSGGHWSRAPCSGGHKRERQTSRCAQIGADPRSRAVSNPRKPAQTCGNRRKPARIGDKCPPGGHLARPAARAASGTTCSASGAGRAASSQPLRGRPVESSHPSRHHPRSPR